MISCTWRCLLPVVGLLAMGALGCSSSSDKKSENRSTTAAAADSSLTADEYLAAGVPAHDRSWAAADMHEAAQALAAVTAGDLSKLPRFKSARSGAVFERMIAADNLEPYRDRGLPVEGRLAGLLAHMDGLNSVNKLYEAKFLNEKKGSRELIEMMGAVLRSAVAMVEVTNEFLPRLDKKDPKYPIKMAGLKRAQEGVATMFFGAFKMLTENEYAMEDRLQLLAYMEATLPNVFLFVPPAAQKETAQRLTRLQGDAVLRDLHPGLQRLELQLQRIEK